jgi:predicted Zn-dependent protease
MKCGWIAGALVGVLAGVAAAGAPERAAPAAAAGPAARGGEAREPTEVERLLKRANELLEARKWPDAVLTLEQAQKLDPRNEMTRFGLAVAYLKVDKFKEALPVLDGLNAQFPGNPSIINNLAWLRLKATEPEIRDPRKGLGLAQQALMLAPMDFNIWGTLAEAYYQLGNFERAARFAAVAVQMSAQARDPSTGEFRRLYYRCREAAGLPAEAEAEPAASAEPPEAE